MPLYFSLAVINWAKKIKSKHNDSWIIFHLVRKSNFNQITKFSYDAYEHENDTTENWSQTAVKIDPLKITFSARL